MRKNRNNVKFKVKVENVNENSQKKNFSHFIKSQPIKSQPIKSQPIKSQPIKSLKNSMVPTVWLYGGLTVYN